MMLNKQIKSIKLMDCDVSVRFINFTKGINVQTIGELVEKDAFSLVEKKQIGPHLLREIDDLILKYTPDGLNGYDCLYIPKPLR